MKKENVMASLWISATAALVSIAYVFSYFFRSLMYLSSLNFITLSMMLGCALLLIGGIYLIEETVKLVFKLKKDENYLVGNKKKQLIILILQGALAIGGLLASITFVIALFSISYQDLLRYAGEYLTIPLTFVAHTVAFVLHLVTKIKASKSAKVEVVEPVETAEK